MGERRMCLCRRCKSLFPERELHLVEVFPETILEPAEHVGQCPVCQAQDDGLGTTITTVTEATCYICEENVVPDFDEMCSECATEMAEDIIDRAKGG